MITEREIQANRKKVADAMRSGHYEQIQDSYRIGDSDEYPKLCCAVGVAFDVLMPDHWEQYGDDYGFKNGHSDELQLCRMLGLTETGELIRLNDKEGYSFTDIADLLEAGDLA